MPEHTLTIPEGYEVAKNPFGAAYLPRKLFMLPVWEELEDHCPAFHSRTLRAFGRRLIEDVHFREVQELRMNSNMPMYVAFNSLMSLLEVQVREVQAFLRDTIAHTIYIKKV